MSQSRFHHRLLIHLSHENYRPADISTLAGDLGVSDDELDEFRAAVEQLAENDQVVVGDNNLVTLPPLGKTLIGTFKRNPKGFGFIIPRERIAHGDLFVPAPDTMGAVTGDVVKARVRFVRQREGSDRSPFVGQVMEILERRRNTFTGELKKTGGAWVVFPDGKVLTDPINVKDPGAKNAHDGDKVVVEVLTYPEGNELGDGVIVRVLGESGRPDVETQAVIEAHNLPGEFPEACLDQARELAKLFEAEQREAREAGGFAPTQRLDITGDFIITIDPPDSKDFDDAISLVRLDARAGAHPTGGPPSRGAIWRLGIHIADVSHFVSLDSALDKEARDRGNSVYLPRHVIPMLPELLSNGICSLQEDVPRFTKSAYIDYDADGVVTGRGYAATIIKSAKRLTYIEAQCLIDGDLEGAKRHARTEPNYTPELLAALRDMNDLAKTIEKRRRRAGMIHLELPDVELVFDEHGHVIDAVPEDDAYTHTLIEMFMVEANEALAALFEDLSIPLLRRIHPEPVPGDMDQLRDFVRVAGYKIPKQPTREELQSLLDATKGTDAAPAIHMSVLRTLARAEYSPALVGHFALASSGYAHFTSPIRRYADLTVHRSLTEYLARTANGAQRPRTDEARAELARGLRESPACPDEGTLNTIGQHCNQTEENAEDAERELRQFLVLQLLEEHVGGSFPGLVTGVAASGVFVRLDKYLAEGMCKREDLPAPRGVNNVPIERPQWQIDKRSGALVERNTGRSYNIGDRVTITIAEIDLARRRMELVITDGDARSAGKSKRLADRLTIGGGPGSGGLDHAELRPVRTGAEKRSQRSRSRDKAKRDFRQDRKNKGRG